MYHFEASNLSRDQNHKHFKHGLLKYDDLCNIIKVLHKIYNVNMLLSTVLQDYRAKLLCRCRTADEKYEHK